MFTIPTLPKIILIVVVIAAVWWFFRRGQARARDAQSGPGMKRTTGKGPANRIEDMVQCAICAAYVPVGSAHCGKDGCPIGS
jgi:hypothetical protein